MLIDLKLNDKIVLVFGGGNVGEGKAMRFLEADSKVIVASKDFTGGLKLLGEQGKIKLVKVDMNNDPSFTGSLISNSDLVIAATNDQKLNENIVEEARKRGILVCAVDSPSISDFYLPAVTRFGDIQVAISTGGKSPAMARILRKKFEKAITKEDVLQVELQSYARKLVRSRIPDRESRRNVLYQIIQNSDIKRLLREGNLTEAKALAKQIIERH